MSHNLSHTIIRSGSFVFNRRVPKAIQSDFGAEVVRIRLGRDEQQAKLLAERLTTKLDQIWASPIVRPVEVSRLLANAKPRLVTFNDAVEMYLANRGAGRGEEFEKVVRIGQRVFLDAAGNKEMTQYDRDDARAMLRVLQETGVKTRTIRRRFDTVKAIFEHAYVEEEIERRNPFSRLSIPGEGLDATKRGTFTLAQMREAYRVALSTRNEIKLIVPILGETGCRLAEVVGLRIKDVDIDEETITITPHPGRRLKTRGSKRVLPLVGAALEAVKLVIEQRKEEDRFLFPRYIKDGKVKATHASNAINKWLKRDFDGLTCHCLRHTMRDRLRAVEAHMDMIDQIGGWASINGVGVRYGSGYSLDLIRATLRTMTIDCIGRHS